MANESLDNVQPGDKLIIRCGDARSLSRWREDQVVTVTRVTRTQIVIGVLRFLKKSGRQVGWGRWHVRRPKKGDLERLRERDEQRVLALQIYHFLARPPQRNAIPLRVVRQIAKLLGIGVVIDGE